MPTETIIVPYYELLAEHLQLVLGDAIHPIPDNAVAMLFDRATGVLHTHCPAQEIHAIARTMRRARADADFDVVTDNFVILEIEPSTLTEALVADVNRCLTLTGFVSGFSERHRGG
jgi:hypothetical protein